MSYLLIALVVCYMVPATASEFTMNEIVEPSPMCLELNELFINFEVLLASEKKAIKQFENSIFDEDTCSDIKLSTNTKTESINKCLRHAQPYISTGNKLLSEYKVLIAAYKNFLDVHQSQLSSIPIGILNLKEQLEDIEDLVPENMSDLVKDGYLFLSARLEEVLSFRSSQFRDSFDSIKSQTIANYVNLATQLMIVDHNEKLRAEYNSFFGTDNVIDFDQEDSEFNLDLDLLDSGLTLTKDEALLDLSELFALSDLKLLFTNQCQ